MMIGYARVSTHDQTAKAQRRALSVAACDRVYAEVASGGRWDRPALHDLLVQLRKDDVVVVRQPDRLARSLHDQLATKHAHLTGEFVLAGRLWTAASRSASLIWPGS